MSKRVIYRFQRAHETAVQICGFLLLTNLLDKLLDGPGRCCIRNMASFLRYPKMKHLLP